MQIPSELVYLFYVVPMYIWNAVTSGTLGHW
jgi:hypothetical protein